MGTSSIGSGRDYPDLPTWASNEVTGTLTEDVIAEVYDDDTLNSTTTLNCTPNGNNIIIRPATGQAFYEAAGSPDNALGIDGSNGIMLDSSSNITLFDIQCSNVQFQGLQVGLWDANGTIFNSTTSYTLDKCYIQKNGGNISTADEAMRGPFDATNCVFFYSTQIDDVDNEMFYVDSDSSLISCTVGRSSPVADVNSRFATIDSGATLSCLNTLVGGWADGFNGAGTLNGDYCALTTDGSGWSLLNNSQTSQSYTSMVRDPSSGPGDYDQDFRAITSSALDGNGTAIGTPAIDIYNQLRANPPWIGAHEVFTGGPGSSGATVIRPSRAFLLGL